MTIDVTNPEKSSQKQIFYFLTYGVCFISLGLGLAALGPALPFLAANTGVSIATISFLFTASNLGYLIGSVGGGRLFDRYRAHRLMTLALGIMIIMTMFIPIISIFPLLLLNMFLFGLGQGIVDIGGNVNLLWVYQSKVGPYMNGLHFCFGIGAFLSPIIIHNVMDRSGGALTWPFWILGLCFLPGLIGLFSLKSPENPEKNVSDSKTQTIDKRLVGLMIALFFINVGVQGGFGGWIFTYALKVQVANEAGASYMNSLFWGALTLGRLLTIPLARKLAPSRILIANFVLSIVFLGMILIWPINATVIWIASAGLGLALSSVFPTLLVLGESRMKITGSVTGLFFLGSGLGSTLLPMLLGQIFEYIGSYQIMVTLFGFSGVGLLVLIFALIASERVGEKTRV